MKKKIAILCLALITSPSFAYVMGYSSVDPYTQGAQINKWADVYTQHSYTVINDSGSTQNVSICWTTTTCADYPKFEKTITECKPWTLKAGEQRAETKLQLLHEYYPFVGYCNINTSQEIFGWQHYVSTAVGKLDIEPDQKK